MPQALPETGEAGTLPKMTRSPPLRRRLLLLVAACNLPLFAFGLGNAYFDYRSDIAGAGRQALALTRTLSLLVERDLDARIATLQVLAMAPTLLSGDFDGFRAHAEAVLAQQLPGANILHSQEDGQQISGVHG